MSFTHAIPYRQNPRLFERLIRDHHRLVVGLGHSIGLRGANLDDAAAETFAQVYCSLPTFQARSALNTWIYQIATRTLRRYRARRSRLRSRECSISMLDAIADKNRSPEQSAMERETREKLWAIVARLEPRQSMAIELCYRRGWHLTQIAEALDCPVGTIKTLLFRARGELGRRLKAQGMAG